MLFYFIFVNNVKTSNNMNANPKLFFTIEQGIFYPYRKFNVVLDKLFTNNKVIKANQEAQSEEIKAFISNNPNSSSTLYVSTDYSWNPKTNVFVFEFIPTKATESDYEELFSTKSKFNPAKEYKLSPTNKKEEKKKAIKKKTSDVVAKPTIDDSGFYIEDLSWKYLIRNIKKNKPTLMIGPTGTGKTELVMLACKTLGISCEIHDMGSMQDPLTDMIGSHRIKNGNSTFDYAKFVEDVQKPGVVLLDELSRAPLMTNNILFPCLDSRHELPLEIADSEGPRSVKVHPDCVFIATANIGSEYSGTNEIDAALLNRFLPLKVNYMPSEQEIDVLVKRCGINKSEAKVLVQFAQLMRDANKNGVVSMPVSTRENIAMGELVADGFTLKEAIELVVCNKYNDDEIVDIKQIMMKL